MNEQPATQNHTTESDTSEVRFGLPMISSWSPEALEAEKSELRELADKPALTRWKGYFSKTGPGWLQSAMTLGGGSAMASLYAGALFQYELLWVQPVAMLLGILMLAAVSHTTLSTGARPFSAMKKHVNPALAWAWAIATLLSTIIWHFPQYALAAGMTEDMIKAATGWTPSSGQQNVLLLLLGVVFLVISTFITWSYGSGSKGVRLYERTLKGFVWMIVLAFAVVVLRQAGSIEWGKVFGGLIPGRIPGGAKGVSVVMGAFGAAVGINMTFLFPYTLLARGWGKEHRGLAGFDLITGMLIPYALATGLMIIAAGCTIYAPENISTIKFLSPVNAAGMIEAAGVGTFFARIIFGLGIIGMALSTITLHMLVSGFAACEIFGWDPTGWKYKLACLFPAPAMMGVILWKYMGSWIAVPTSAICGLLLPIAYLGFLLMHNSKSLMGEDRPVNTKRIIWNLGMIAALGAALASSIYYIITHKGFFGL